MVQLIINYANKNNIKLNINDKCLDGFHFYMIQIMIILK